MKGMKIRKQCCELTLDDLSKFPVWEFALDEEGVEGQDEGTVRPCEISAALDPSERTLIVRAEFTLADGTKMSGWLTPPVQGDDSLGTLQPVIITERGHVGFWHGMRAPDVKGLAQSYERLGRDAARVFPVQVTSNVNLVRAPIRVTIPGFLVLEDFKTRKTRIVI
jgi:hypothetical protein